LRVVIDPGVYIAATLSSVGAPAQLMRLWRLRHFDMIISPKLIAELDRTLRRDRFRGRVTLADVDDLIDELRRSAQLVDDPEHPSPVSRDPDDDYLIAIALHAKTDVLISGDRDLTDLVDPPVRILTPRGLLDELIPPKNA
jgi:putative PIN family toxin of toxin-antitoxin system